MMKHLGSKKVVVSAVLLTLAGGAAFAQAGKMDAGKDEYDSNCAVCHGTDAKGKEGPLCPVFAKPLQRFNDAGKTKRRRLAG